MCVFVCAYVCGPARKREVPHTQIRVTSTGQKKKKAGKRGKKEERKKKGTTKTGEGNQRVQGKYVDRESTRVVLVGTKMAVDGQDTTGSCAHESLLLCRQFSQRRDAKTANAPPFAIAHADCLQLKTKQNNNNNKKKSTSTSNTKKNEKREERCGVDICANAREKSLLCIKCCFTNGNMLHERGLEGTMRDT